MECRRASIDTLQGNGRKSNKEGCIIYREIFERNLRLYNITPDQVGIRY